MVHTIDLGFQGIPKAIAAFLIKTEEGPVLVESGPSSTLSNLHKSLYSAGVNPGDIKHVFLTHIHLDHAGAAWHFAENGAVIYVHPKGKEHLNDPSRLLISAKRIYQDRMDELWGSMKPISGSHIKPVNDREEIGIGNLIVKAWHTPGHASHHIAWQIGNFLFSGDVAGVKIGDGPVVPPCPPPDISIEDWESSIETINMMNLESVYLTHFGKISNVGSHLGQLKVTLNEWAYWVKARMEEGWDADKMIPEFQKYVHERLRKLGVNDEIAQKYEAANPSWMSVSGLLTYWEKKIRLKE